MGCYLEEFNFNFGQINIFEEHFKSRGIWVVENPVAAPNQGWYLLERNQQILFRKIQNLGEVSSLVISGEEPSVIGFEACDKHWTTSSTNQQRLSDALDYLIANAKQSPPSLVVGCAVKPLKPSPPNTSPPSNFSSPYPPSNFSGPPNPSPPSNFSGPPNTYPPSNFPNPSPPSNFSSPPNPSPPSDFSSPYQKEFVTFTEQNFYESRLRKGVFVIPKILRNNQGWYILERNQQILFKKIDQLAEVYSLTIPGDEPVAPGYADDAKLWFTLTHNQRLLYHALEYLIRTRKPFKPSPEKQDELRRKELHYYDQEQLCVSTTEAVVHPRKEPGGYYVQE